MKELLHRLSDVHGPSGQESAVADLLEQELSSLTAEITRDRMGNLVATIRGKEDGPIVLLCAHIDEIGGMVRYVDNEGFVYFDAVGGHNPRVLEGSRVTIGGKVRGVVQAGSGAQDGKPALADLYIDIGAAGKKQAESAGIRLGSPITRIPSFSSLIGSRVMGKALDNRAGVAVMIDSLRRLRDVAGTVIAVASCQEEVGTRGAKVSAFGLKPDLAIALDVTFANDTPQKKNSHSVNTRLGKGPALTLKDDGYLIPPRMRAFVEGVATREGVPLQYDISTGATDASPISLSGSGIPTAALLIPLRYMHSGNEIADLEDMAALSRLVAALVKSAGDY
jgi:endoglucanase